MRLIAALLLIVPATACQQTRPGEPPRGAETVVLGVELFESEQPEADLADPRQAASLGRQTLSSWSGGSCVYDARASLVSRLPDHALRAADGGGIGAAPGDAVAVPADYLSPWRLQLELRPVFQDGRWLLGGELRWLAGAQPTAIVPIEPAPAAGAQWRLPLGPSHSSGGHLTAVVELTDFGVRHRIPPADRDR